MASSILKFPVIIEQLKNMGIEKEVPKRTLRIELIRATGLTKDTTIANALKLMEELGYVRQCENDSIVEICKENPYEFWSDDKEKIENILEGKE